MPSSSMPPRGQYTPVDNFSQDMDEGVAVSRNKDEKAVQAQRAPNKGRRLDFDGSTQSDTKFNNTNGDLSKIRVVVPPQSIVTINLTMSDNTNRTITFENVSETESMPGRLYLGKDGHIGVAEGVDTRKDDNGKSIPSLPSIFGKHSTSRDIKLLFQNSVDPVNFKTSILSEQFPGFRLDTKKIKPKVKHVDIDKESLAERRNKDDITRSREEAKKLLEKNKPQSKPDINVREVEGSEVDEEAVSVDYTESESESESEVPSRGVVDRADSVAKWIDDVSNSNTLKRQESVSSKASEYFECENPDSEVHEEAESQVKDEPQNKKPEFVRRGDFNIPKNNGVPKRPDGQLF